jgi:hypothetical protein
LGQDSDARLGAVALESIADRGGNVMARREMTGANDIVGKRAIDEHLGVTLDQGLNLGLPLFWADKARRGEQREDLLGAGGGTEQMIEVTSGGNTLTTFAGEDEGAAGLENARAGAHAFDALVQVEVEGIPAVGGDDDFERGFDFLHGGMSDEFITDLVCLEEVAGESSRNLSLFVERDIEQEAGPGAEGDVPEFFPEWIAVGDAEGGAGIADVGCAMIAHDGFEAGATGHDSFGSAAEPGEEVGFDKTRDDAEVGFDHVPVEQGRGTGPCGSHLDEGIAVLGFVIEDAVTFDDGGRQHTLEFLERVGPMGAQLIEEQNPVARMIGEFIEQPWDEAIVRGGASQVGKRDADPVAGADTFAEGQGTDGLIESPPDSAEFVFKPRLMSGLNDRGAIGGQVDGELRLAVGEMDVHSVTSSFAGSIELIGERSGEICDAERKSGRGGTSGLIPGDGLGRVPGN